MVSSHSLSPTFLPLLHLPHGVVEGMGDEMDEVESVGSVAVSEKVRMSGAQSKRHSSKRQG